MLLSWRWQRKKAKAEADGVEQDVYQEIIGDLKADRDDRKAYIKELKEDRKHLLQERDELRVRQDKMEEEIRSLQREVARNGKILEGVRPLMCGMIGCRNRQPVDIKNNEEKE